MTTLDQSFTARQVPWMKIGKIIDDPHVNAAEAARLGGIDFDVELRPSGYWTDHEVIDDGQGNQVFIDDEGNHVAEPGHWTVEPSRFAVVRPDAKSWFSYVSDEYQLVQFTEAFDFMDNVNPRYVAAGALNHGHQGFMIVQLPDHLAVDVEVNGEHDPHEMYVVLQTSHDLSKAIKISVMMLRGKCMNMLTLPSFNRDVVQSWSIRHVGDPHEKLKEAHRTLTRASDYQQTFERLTTQFGSVRVTSDDLRHIARRVLPERLKTREEQVEAIVDRFESSETVGFKETGWGAINAVSDYMQWGRTTAVRTAQSEFTSPLDGDAAKYVNRTAQLVMARA